jgi:hypothetical protein
MDPPIELKISKSTCFENKTKKTKKQTIKTLNLHVTPSLGKWFVVDLNTKVAGVS